MQAATFSDRQATLGRLVNTLTSKRAPLSDTELTTLRKVTAELEVLQRDIADDAQRKASSSFAAWLRRGLHPTQFDRGISESERAALSVLSFDRLDRRDMGSGGSGAYPSATTGFFAPLEFQTSVESAMKSTGAMLAVATTDTTPTGRLLPFPMDDDRVVAGERINESLQVTSEDIAAIGAVVLSSFKYSSRLVKVSIEFLQDTGINFSAWLAERLGIRLARAIDPDLLSGTGSGMPTGALVSASVGAQAVGSSVNDGTAAGTNTIGKNDLENLIGSVDVAYRDRDTAGFILHSDTLNKIKELTDKQGRPLRVWKSQFENASGIATLCGYPVYVDPNMPTLQTQASSPPVTVRSVLFGDLSRYRIRRTPLQVFRLTQRFAEYGQVAFFCTLRLDGALIDGSQGAGNGFAVKCLTNTF